jgi:hydrogenase-4 component B
LLAFLLAFVGFGSKAGVFPLHVWLPHAHPAAPSPISAVMSGVMIKVGVYGIARVYAMLDGLHPAAGVVVLIVGMISGVLGVVYALGQHDIKRLLAYHSVENIGIILIGLGIGMIGASQGRPLMAALGLGGGLLHVLNHAIFKSLLFLGAGMVIHRTGVQVIDELGSLLKSMKVTGTCFLIGSLAISGLPPLNGFVSEFLIYLAGFQGVALEANLPFALSLAAIVCLAVIGGLALACFTKVVGVVFQGEPRRPLAGNGSEKGAAMLAPMVALAAACAVIGLFPAAFVTLALRAAAVMAPQAAVPAVEPMMAAAGGITRAALVFVAVVLSVAGLRHLLYRAKTVSHGPTWGCGFTQPNSRMQYTGASFADSILAFFRPVAPVTEDHPPVQGLFPGPTHYHSHVHDIAESHLMRFVVSPVVGMFDRLRWIQHGDIHLYIGYILLAIGVLLFFV